MNFFFTHITSGAKYLNSIIMHIKITVIGNRFNNGRIRFGFDFSVQCSQFLVNRCPLLLLHLTVCTSFFGNCLVHVVTYYNITHKDKLKGQLRIISIRTSLSKGYWPKTDQFVNFNFINFIVRLYHFIVRFKLSSCQNWEIISNRNIVVL